MKADRPWFNPAAKAVHRAMRSAEANRPLPTAHGDPVSTEVTEKTPTLYKSLLAMQRGEWGDKAPRWEMRGFIAEMHRGPSPRFSRKRRRTAAPKKGKKAA